MVSLESPYRTHTCGQLRAVDAGKAVTLSGWILRKRDHGGVVFVDLRDNYGVTQVVLSGDAGAKIQEVRTESVVTLKGEVTRRAEGMVNTKIPTGEIELHAQELEVISHADVLPFLIYEDDNAPEPTRLKYRFLELRREHLHENILLRSKVIRSIREIMHELGFTEFQTPILTSSSPEGARDFIVPSRFHPGKFFALPQAPQQFKQLIMVAGFDRYFQIAPCFRDEDPRADRSPGEFYQLDLEMSFVTQEQVFAVGDQLCSRLFKSISNWQVSDAPFPRIKFKDAMERYGSDKPDLRNPLLIEKVSEVFKDTGFKVFQNVLAGGGNVFALKLPVKELPPRKFFDDTVKSFMDASGQGLAYLNFDAEGAKGTIAKFVSETEIAALRSQLGIEGTCVVFFGAGDKKVLPHLGRLRTKLGVDFDLLEKGIYKWCWITDFPMYEKDEETGQVIFSHNPFSMPQGGLEALKTKDPLEIDAYQYDIVCNGVEISSGAIRNHEPETMYEAFRIAGYSRDDVDTKFGGMIRAFKFGAPPHGGFAPGIDRMVMLLADENTIRDVIMFPMAQSVEDLMMGAPSEVSKKQLDEVHLQVKPLAK